MEEKTFWRNQMKELLDEFGFKCDCLKHCRDVIQNEFRNGLSDEQSKTLIKDFEKSFEYNISKLRNTSHKIKEYIWSQTV